MIIFQIDSIDTNTISKSSTFIADNSNLKIQCFSQLVGLKTENFEFKNNIFKINQITLVLENTIDFEGIKLNHVSQSSTRKTFVFLCDIP